MAADRVRPGPTERFIQAQLVVWIFVLLGLLLMWNGAGR